ncbi:Protein of unknown function [Flavobacterium indicum GPTSA100-9 = DSM 17447]|uniref:DUF4325 domain-containing protein n=1 Tax=Flavobacterium indicum (strain DSM 17447 / CIP 109464 / GPTSA100-9) TaxID=1094466 RepID=H8XUH7_FLAIG|nr:STAS-like domain-containing protein [Flavobacterium indicum]CCG52960.1 Protein of unknown function [Flavobacterium indicum GPTSA100-9 = DSM 17447]
MEISILENFSEYPGLRHCKISDKSGEEFYHSVLNEKFYEVFSNDEKLIVDLDNTGGYASSFLDEAFGNLVFDFTLEKVKNKIEIISTQEPHWKDMILDKTFKEWENRRLQKVNPVVTLTHKPWYRLVENNLIKDVWESPVVV